MKLIDAANNYFCSWNLFSCPHHALFFEIPALNKKTRRPAFTERRGLGKNWPAKPQKL